MNCQTLDDLKETMENYLKRNQKVTPMSLYKYLRSLPKYSWFGDYPFLTYILRTTKNLQCPARGLILKKALGSHLCDLSHKFSGKKDVIKQLEEI